MPPGDLKITRPPIALQQYRLSLSVNTSPTFGILQDPVLGSRFSENRVPQQSQSFVCNLPGINKVSLSIAAFGNPNIAIAFGRNQNPRISDPGTVVLLSTFQIQPIQTSPPALPFTASTKNEMDISSDYRYFTPYIYSSTGGGIAMNTAFSYDINSSLALVTFYGQ